MRSTSPAQPPPCADRPPAARAGHCLCLNAAEGLLQFCIARQEAVGPAAFTLLCAQTWHAPSQGAELLAPALADALTRLGLAPGDIGRIACVRGPGSFTGLRLTLATATGLARITRAEQAGLDYLPLLAHSAWRRMGGFSDGSGNETREGPDARNESGARNGLSAREAPGVRQKRREFPVWVITHARRNLVHVQGFFLPAFRHCSGSGAVFAPMPLTDILVCPPDEAALLVHARWKSGRDGPGRPVLLGSGLSRNRDAIAAVFAANAAAPEPPATDRGHCPPAGMPLLLPADFDHPLPESLLENAVSSVYSARDIEPLYVRPADAEENLERIALSLGLDPEQARAKLGAIRQPLN